MNISANVKPDAEFRERLLSYFIEMCTAAELTDWLRNIGQDARGSVEEKRQRVRAHTQYLTMPAADFPAQTENYLSVYSSDHLADLCADLAINPDGTKDERYRRIMREVHYREGWLSRPDASAAIALSAETVMPYLDRFPVTTRGRYEKDFYPAVFSELSEVFGNVVYEQLPVAHGSTLKIDFHVGDPLGHGVGIEVKMPASNGDVQRAMGQLDQYQQRYGRNLILILIGDFLKAEVLSLFQKTLTSKSIFLVTK